MLTVDALCSDMEASGRRLTPRAARDWWTKGLLPRPCRRRLGRGKGTKTFWATADVSRQAKAAYDLLARHARTDMALLHLWLMGFHIDLRSVRTVYLELNQRHLRAIHKAAGKQPEDIIGDLAGKLARRQVSKRIAPVDAQHAYADVAVEFLSIFYGSETEPMVEGLAELWEKAVPYVDSAGSQVGGLADLHPSDEVLARWAHNLKQFVSLPAQHAMIGSVSDYELMRVRRLLRFVLEHLHRIARAAERKEVCEGSTVLHLTAPLVPVLVAILRDDTLRSKVVTSLLDVVRMLPSQAEWPALMRAARKAETLKSSSTVH